MILGAGGLLGRAVARRLERDSPDTIAATRAEIDIADRFGLEAEVERLRPTVIVNCAAYTDVDGCTRDPERAREVNAQGAENVARAAAASGCRMVQISTDFVFDGRADRPYVESDAVNPLSEYGRSKLEGERLVAAAAPDHLIVRTAWLYGEGGKTFVEKIRQKALAGEALRVVADQSGSPTWVEDLADALAALLATAHRGVAHVVNSGVCSRFELAAAILEAIGRAGRVPLEPSQTVPAPGVAVRPARAGLDPSLYARLTGQTMRPWRTALRDYLGRSAPGGEA
jgi:dTDP-4-dehydrorhamnose reductase